MEIENHNIVTHKASPNSHREYDNLLANNRNSHNVWDRLYNNAFVPSKLPERISN
jgi:hypothetical protein